MGVLSYAVNIIDRVHESGEYRCSIVTEWRSPEQRGLFGMIVKPSELKHDTWTVRVDADTGMVIDIEKTN